MTGYSSFLSSYMQELIKLDVPQFELLNSSRFVDFLRVRDIRLSKEDLEHFEKVGFLYPILRLRRPKTSEGDKYRYSGIFEGSWMWKEYAQKGLLEFPDSTNSRPWVEYKDGYEDSTFIYYHPYQIFLVERFLSLTQLLLTSSYLEEATDCKKMFEQAKNMHEHTKRSFLKARPTLIKQIGLLLLLQNAYEPVYRQRIHLTFEKDSFETWLYWKEKEFSPSEVLEDSGMQLEEVKNLRNYFAAQTAFIDPLSHWYPLIRLVQFAKKERMKGSALLAQDYYEIVGILNLFLMDLTGEKQPDPDDIMDGRQGKWKKEFYGREFDYSDKEIQRKIVSDYLDVAIPKVVLLVEGYSEETAIPILMEAFGKVPENEGIAIHNFEGTGGIAPFNVSAVLRVARDQKVGSYLIVDNDQGVRELVQQLTGKLKLLNDDCFKIWDTDFEQENFGIDLVVGTVNEELMAKGLPTIEMNAVKREVSTSPNKKLFKVVRDECWLRNNVDLEIYVSKKSLARTLSTKRAEEIVHEVNEGKYKPKWKIEEEILKIHERFCQ